MASRNYFLLLILSTLLILSLNQKSLLEEALSSTTSARQEFMAFKTKYKKNYTTEEEEYRFSVFVSNLRNALRNQIKDPNAVHGVTKFSDLTAFEFQRKYVMKAAAAAATVTTNSYHHSRLQAAPVLATDNLPYELDWRQYGAVTPVKLQECGSCWAFAATGALEAAHFLATQKLVNLSQQQILDCSHECYPQSKDYCTSGCDGGYAFLAYKYIADVGGIELEQDYPDSTTGTGTCKFNKTKSGASVRKFMLIQPSGEDQFAANLVKHGPITVGFDSSRMGTYKSGVSCPPCGDKNGLDHELVVVGYMSDHWILKNSWGQDVGEDGYYRICKGGLICDDDPIATAVIANSSSGLSLQVLYLILIGVTSMAFYLW